MKYITKFLLMGIVAVAGLLSACTSSDDFEPGPKDSGAQVYFPNTIPSEFNVGDDESSVTIPVRRVVTDEALTVNIFPIIEQGQEGILNIPSTVSFEAGSDLANLVITFDRSTLVDGTEYKASLFLNDEPNLTQYGNYMIDITITPWPWEELGTGKFRDDWFAPMWQNGGNPEIDVTIHKHKSKEGVYMVEEMFGWPYLTEFFGDTQAAIESQLVTYQSTNITIDCSDPTKVLMPRQFTGIIDLDPSYGNYEIAQFQDMYGTLEDGVITFPKEALALVCSAGSMATNLSGLFRIMLPGAEDVDYTLAVAYSGMKVGADNATTSAMMDFTYGADVTGIHYVIAEGDVTATVANIAATIANGTAENIYEIEDFEVGGEKVSVEAALANAGLYTVVALPLDKSGKAVEKNAVATSFYFPGMNGSEISDCDLKVEAKLISDYDPELLEQYPDETSLAFIVTGTDITSMTYYLNTTSIINSIEDGSMGITMEEVMASNGNVATSEDLEMIATGNLALIYGKMNPGTSYTLVASAINKFGRSATVKATLTTPYSGELVIGNYVMSCEAETTDGETIMQENNISILPNGTDGTQFLVGNFAYELDIEWYATYDSAKSELELSGEWKYNEGDNFLGKWVAFTDTEAFLFASIDPNSGEEESDGTYPLIIGIDPDTKQPNKLKSIVQVLYGTISTEGVTPQALIAVYYPDKTTFKKVESSQSGAYLPSAMLSKSLASFSNMQEPVSNQIYTVCPVTLNGLQAATLRTQKAGIRTLDVKVSKCESLPKQINGHAKISKQANNRPLM